ncbi:TetR/AcrR family transcriptional regulator [Kitasatospora viridis]
MLTAALTLLERDGYPAVTMKGIAEAAGVGRATVYRWWSAPAAVLMEALTELSRERAEPELTGDPEADLLAFLTATFALTQDGPSRTVLLILVAEALDDPEIAAGLAEHTGRRRELLRGLLERLDARWTVPLELAVDMVFGTMWYRMIDLHGPVDDRLATELCAAVKKLSS